MPTSIIDIIDTLDNRHHKHHIGNNQRKRSKARKDQVEVHQSLVGRGKAGAEAEECGYSTTAHAN